jgi:hypothetical protein
MLCDRDLGLRCFFFTLSVNCLKFSCTPTEGVCHLFFVFHLFRVQRCCAAMFNNNHLWWAWCCLFTHYWV